MPVARHFSLYAAVAGLLLAACSGAPVNHSGAKAMPPLQAAAHVDLQRYMGRWYLLANIPNRDEAGKVAVSLDYSLRNSGRIKQIFTARDTDFTHEPQSWLSQAHIADRRSNARWKLADTWALGRESVILYVDPDYRHALVGHPSRSTVWLLSRETRITDEQFEVLMKRLDAQGYDTLRVRKLPQVEDQLGAPGYQ